MATTTTTAERYDALVAWVEAAGGNLHPSVEIYQDENTEGSLRVKPGHSISAGDSIVKLPLVRCLSFLNAICGHPDFQAAATLGVATPSPSPPPPSSSSSSSSSRYFPTEFLKKTPPHVIGRFFLIQQYLLGDESLWAPYIQTLPQPGDPSGLLPCAWPKEDVEFLRGTNAYVAVREINATLDKEYAEAITLLRRHNDDEAAAAASTGTDSGNHHHHHHHDYTQELYKWAYCIFASRSFRQSLTIPAATALSLTEKADDFSVLLPLFDMGNHHPLAKTAWKTPGGENDDSDNNNDNNEPSRSSSGSTQAPQPALFCELQTGQPYSGGQQIFNNYGSTKTNAELLLGYGFVLAESDDFHNDYVHVKTRPSSSDSTGGSSNSSTAAAALASTHLVSLRPIADLSSLAGRARLLDPDPTRILSCYTHVQDTLVASLYEMICQARVVPLPPPPSSSASSTDAAGKSAFPHPTLSDILAGENVSEALTDEMINALGTKLSIDLEAIEDAEQGVGGGGAGGGSSSASSPAMPRNGNQLLAVLYRTQCKRVLENALASLVGEEEEEDQ